MDGRRDAFTPVALDEVAHPLVAYLVALPQQDVREIVHVSDEVQPRGGRRDAPVGFQVQPVILFELRFDSHMDAMKRGFAVGEENLVVHVPEII